MTDRPWMTALEMQFAALRRLDAENATPAFKVLKNALRSAQAFAWAKDTTSAVFLASKTIPNDVAPDLTLQLEAPWSSWWWFDQPLLIPGHAAPRPSERLPLHGLLISRYPDTGLFLTSFALVENTPIPASVWEWGFQKTLVEWHTDFARRYPEEYDIEALSLINRFWLAASVWLQQRIVTISTCPVERHRRKQLAREHDAPAPSDVKVIQLRRVESESRRPSAGGESVEWTCRWIVSSHWRNQPCKDGRKLIAILPYIKGPADKPLKVPTHTVYQVSR